MLIDVDTRQPRTSPILLSPAYRLCQSGSEAGLRAVLALGVLDVVGHLGSESYPIISLLPTDDDNGSSSSGSATMSSGSEVANSTRLQSSALFNNVPLATATYVIVDYDYGHVFHRSRFHIAVGERYTIKQPFTCSLVKVNMLAQATERAAMLKKAGQYVDSVSSWFEVRSLTLDGSFHLDLWRRCCTAYKQ